MASPLPRIPPPPQPELDWSTPATYLRTCNEWLDRMQDWQTRVLPEWIEQSRRHLLQRALLDPETRTTMPDLRLATSKAASAQSAAAVQEIRLPAID